MNASPRVIQRTIVLLFVILACGCSPVPSEVQATPADNPGDPSASTTPLAPIPSVGLESEDSSFSLPEPTVVFAVIGDYGTGDQVEGAVADLVKSWQPEFIITTGDNNYPSGS